MTETIAIVDYGSGNLRSVQKALERAIADGRRSASAALTADADVIANADRVVLPGVGAFRACMEGLCADPSVLDALTHAVKTRGAPFLGICVGMQLLADRGLEFGETPGLGWIAGDVAPLEPSPSHRVPHIGWNTVRFSNHPVFDSPPDDFYFVHSFHFAAERDEDVVGVCDYGQPIAAAIAVDNLAATQFHPEKSQGAGLALLDRFLGWRP